MLQCLHCRHYSGPCVLEHDGPSCEVATGYHFNCPSGAPVESREGGSHGYSWYSMCFTVCQELIELLWPYMFMACFQPGLLGYLGLEIMHNSYTLLCIIAVDNGSRKRVDGFGLSPTSQ